MELGLVGLPRSGKTTVFNALTRGNAPTGEEASGRPNLGVAKMPDARLDRLNVIFQAQRVVPAEVRYVDIPGAPPELGGSEGIGGQYLNTLERVDVLALVIRAFEDGTVAHSLGSVDPHRDLTTMQMELAFADLNILERRAQRLDDGLKGAKPAQREALRKEQTLVTRLKEALEVETAIRELELTSEEARTLQNYQFLTAKPLLVVWNIGEEALERAAALETELRERYHRPGMRLAVLCGKLEMELAQMNPEEERQFREGLGVEESGLKRIITLSADLLALVTFFTTASQEVRAWTVPQNTLAAAAAGKIHTDMERGFIRAEVMHFADLDRCGSVAEARRQGLLRVEGRSYLVKEGDIITFRFNV